MHRASKFRRSTFRAPAPAPEPPAPTSARAFPQRIPEPASDPEPPVHSGFHPAGPGPRSRAFSASTSSTVSTSFKLDLDGLDSTSTPGGDDVVPRFQELSIADDSVGDHTVSSPHTVVETVDRDRDSKTDWGFGGGRGADTRRPTPDAGEPGNDSGSSTAETTRRRSKKKHGGGGGGKKGRWQGKAPEMVVVGGSEGEKVDRDGRHRQQHHDGGEGGKSRAKTKARRSYEEEAELMMAIWNGTEQLGTIRIQMCMDEAGRWRIGWGQLVD